MKLVVLISVLVLGIASANADDQFTCPVTKPGSAPVTLSTGTFSGLFGTENLWTLFPGNWQNIQKTERGYLLRRVAWGTATYDLKQEGSTPGLTLTGRRLDADSEPLQFGKIGAAWSGGKNEFIMSSEFYVPTLGCWEVTGHFHGTDLTIVVDLK